MRSLKKTKQDGSGQNAEFEALKKGVHAPAIFDMQSVSKTHFWLKQLSADADMH